MKKILIAEHYGFCMGVKRAIATAEETMAVEKNVTILNEIVHNESIVERFRRAGVGQSNDIDKIERGTVIISAHGAAPEISRRAKARGLTVVDATCPLVIRIHKIILKLAKDGYHILHFGDAAHDETVGIVGHAPEQVTVIPNVEALENLGMITGKVALTSQTTAHIADFAEVEKAARIKFPQIEVFNTICNATTQRQAAIMDLAPRVDIMLVVGSQTSANSKRLVQISRSLCGRAHLIDSAADIRPEWFLEGKEKLEIVGLSAGASTPDFLIDGAIERLREIAGGDVEVLYPKRRIPDNRLAIDGEES